MNFDLGNVYLGMVLLGMNNLPTSVAPFMELILFSILVLVPVAFLCILVLVIRRIINGKSKPE